MSNLTQLHSPVSLSTEYDENSTPAQGQNIDHNSPQYQTSLKRKRTTSKTVKKDERKKISRACDSCKAKKVRCSGTLPCKRCSNQSLQCDYYAEHRRGNPASPIPAAPADYDTEGLQALSSVSNQLSKTNSRQKQKLQQRENSNSKLSVLNLSKGLSRIYGPPKSVVGVQQQFNLTSSNTTRKSSQEPDETQFGGDYIGPTSGIAFLHRAQRRFQQDVSTLSIISQSSRGVSVFSFGDGRLPGQSENHASGSGTVKTPSMVEARYLLQRYFDFAMPTYRFLHRATVDTWFRSIYHDSEYADLDSLSSAKVAVVLLILATAKLYQVDDMGALRDGEVEDAEESDLYESAELKLTKETGPVRLESVQARLAQCIYLLASSRINQAWYTFGTATQMILALGLHRQRYSHSADLVEIECRKRVFWSAYTLDRYLSVILGRPRIFRDEDVDQHMPDRLNDTDLTSGTDKSKSAFNQCVADGPIFHARLAQIIGGISSDLYPTNRTLTSVQSSERWTAELKAWKESLPAFLEPSKVDPSILIPIFQRQSTVLRLAYAHALILANRSSLLSDFADLSRRHDLPAGTEGSVKECIDAAILVVDTVNGFIEDGKMCKAFWFTHYVSFCAIATLYVYTIQNSIPRAGTSQYSEASLSSTENNNLLFEAAERCQRSIVATTALTSPFRRYNIILDELKREVLHRLERITCHQGSSSNRANFTDNRQLQVKYQELATQRLTAELDSPNLSKTSSFGALGNIESHPLNVIAADELLNMQSASNGHLSDSLHLNLEAAHSVNNPMYEESMLGLGLFGGQGGLVGWQEFDSCAISWPDELGMYDQVSGL